MTRLRVASAATLVGVLLVGGLSCGTEPPMPGTVTVSLTTPSSDDGAVAVTVTGPGLSNLVPASTSYRVFWRLASENELRALVFGNVTAGPLFTVAVAEVNNPSKYTGTITEVASRDDELRIGVSGYGVTVAGIETR